MTIAFSQGMRVLDTTEGYRRYHQVLMPRYAIRAAILHIDVKFEPAFIFS